MRKFLLLPLAALSLFGSCKQDDNGIRSFELEGIVPVQLDNQAPTQLPIKVVAGTNLQENVNLKVQGLPPGVTATVIPDNGIPPFNATVNFSTDLSSEAGQYSYTIRAIGASTDYSGSSTLFLGRVNYFSLGNTIYDLDSMQKIEHISGSHFAAIIKNASNTGIALNFKSDELPKTNGDYNITDFNLDDHSVGISLSLGNNMNYISAEVNKFKLHYYYKSGKIGFQADSVLMKDVSTGATMILNADVREK